MATYRPAVRLGTVEPFAVKGGEGSLDGVGVGAGLDGEVTDGGSSGQGFHVPSVMRARKLSASWIQMGRVSSMRIDASLLPFCINTLIQ